MAAGGGKGFVPESGNFTEVLLAKKTVSILCRNETSVAATQHRTTIAPLFNPLHIHFSGSPPITSSRKTA